MSLTSHLDIKDDPIRLFLRERFPHTKPLITALRAAIAGVETTRPQGTVPWSLIGMAIDRRIRGYFAPVDFQGIAGTGIQWLWRKGGWDLRMIVGGELEEWAAGLGSPGRRLDRAEEERLCRFCLMLAMFEAVFRSGEAPQPLRAVDPDALTTEAFLAIPEQPWVDDLCQLSWAFYEVSADRLGSPVILNPVFAGSSDVGGADADLVLEGCLLEIKTALDLKRSRPEWFYQLLGYVLLDYEDAHKITDLGFYLARQATYVRWPLEDFLETMAGGEAASRAALRSTFRRVTQRS